MNVKSKDLKNVKVKIYELRDPRDVECKPRYVGITTQVLKIRLKSHIGSLKSRGNTLKKSWIKSLLKDNIRPTIHLIEEVVGWDYACEVEKYWIKEFKEQGYNLKNGTLGGEGTLGNKLSEEQKKKWSEIKKQSKNPRYRHDLDRGLIVKEYLEGYSAAELGRKYKITYGVITKLLKNNNIPIRKTFSYDKRIILQYDLEGNFLKEWYNIKDIKEFLGRFYINKSSLLCKNVCLGYIWKEYTENYPLIIQKLTRSYNNQFCKENCIE